MIQTSKKGYTRYLQALKYLLFLHLSALTVNSLYRIALFSSTGYIPPSSTGAGDIFPAFIRGIWFDNVIACYIFIVPLVAISIGALFNFYGRSLWRGVCIFMSTFHIITFAIQQPIYLISNTFSKSSTHPSSIGWNIWKPRQV